MSFLQELEKIMAGYRLSGEGYTDEEMRVLKRMCKSMLADIDEFPVSYTHLTLPTNREV